jgi:aldose 1-epimerase
MRRLLSLLLLTAIPAMTPAQQSEEKPYGKLPDGTPVTEHTLKSKNGMVAKVITYGGILTSLTAPSAEGGKLRFEDVVLGYNNLEGYLKGTSYFGANAGRCANRIANAKFTLDGKEYTLAANNGKHSLHGGKVGFDKVVWKSEPTMTADGPGVKLTYLSKDDEEGYPGNLNVTVIYTLTNDNALRVEYRATTDKATVCNIAHHSYFNLAGHDSGDILGHRVCIYAKNYTPGDDTLIPTGEIKPVAGTPFDFTESHPIGQRIKEIKAIPQGYDLNYVIDDPKPDPDGPGGGAVPPNPDGLRPAAFVVEPKSGREMSVDTSEPGIQFYTGNFLDGKSAGKGLAVYKQYGAFCLECQKFPDAIHQIGTKGWASPILKPGETYKSITVYRFKIGK